MKYTPERNAKAFETILAIIKARALQKTLDPKTPNPKIQALSSEPSTVQPNIASEPGDAWFAAWLLQGLRELPRALLQAVACPCLFGGLGLWVRGLEAWSRYVERNPNCTPVCCSGFGLGWGELARFACLVLDAAWQIPPVRPGMSVCSYSFRHAGYLATTISYRYACPD